MSDDPRPALPPETVADWIALLSVLPPDMRVIGYEDQANEVIRDVTVEVVRRHDSGYFCDGDGCEACHYEGQGEAVAVIVEG